MTTAADKSPLGKHGITCTARAAKSRWGENLTPRVRRYALRRAARRLLPAESVAYCGRNLAISRHGADVDKVRGTRQAWYGNVMHCGSVWACPVCAAAISEGRREWLGEGVYRWRADGHAVMLLTFTASHEVGDRCADNLAAVTESHSDFYRFRAGQELQARYGIEGRCRGLEPTVGVNGWHIHFHELVFLSRELTDVEFAAFTVEAKAHWQWVTRRNGLWADEEHGLIVQRGWETVGDYVTKFGLETGWTVVHEVTRGHIKRSVKGGRTPMQLLVDYLVAGDYQAGELWREYATVFKGRRQLVWSKRLCELPDGSRKKKPFSWELGLGQEKTDGDLLKEKDTSGATILANLPPTSWWEVLRLQIDGELLDVAAEDMTDNDWRSVKAFLEQYGITDVFYPLAGETMIDQVISSQGAGPSGGESEVDQCQDETEMRSTSAGVIVGNGCQGGAGVGGCGLPRSP